MTSTPPWNAAEVLIDFVGRVGMMLPIGARTQPVARTLRSRVARGGPHAHRPAADIANGNSGRATPIRPKRGSCHHEGGLLPVGAQHQSLGPRDPRLPPV